MEKKSLNNGFVEYSGCSKRSGGIYITFGKVTMTFSPDFIKEYKIKKGDRAKFFFNKATKQLAIQVPAEAGLAVSKGGTSKVLFVNYKNMLASFGIAIPSVNSITDIEEVGDNTYVVQL